MSGWLWLGVGVLLGMGILALFGRRKPSVPAVAPPPSPPRGQTPEKWNTESGKPTVRWGFGQACPRCGSRHNTIKTYKGRKVAGCQSCRTVGWYDASYDDILPDIDDLIVVWFFLQDSGDVYEGAEEKDLKDSSFCSAAEDAPSCASCDPDPTPCDTSSGSTPDCCDTVSSGDTGGSCDTDSSGSCDTCDSGGGDSGGGDCGGGGGD